MDGSSILLFFFFFFVTILPFWWPSKDDSSDGRRGTNHLGFQVNNNNVRMLTLGFGGGVPVNHRPLCRVGRPGEANPSDSPLPLFPSSPRI